MHNLKLFIVGMTSIMAISLMGCTPKGHSEDNSSNSSSGKNDSSSVVPGPIHTQTEVEEYMNNLKSTSTSGHLYVHYYRFHESAAEFNAWDIWAWPYKPKEGEGYKFDWKGRTTSPDRISATGDAELDSFYYATVDIDLTAEYDGGWDKNTRKMGGTPTNFYADNEKTAFDDQVGIQIVETATRTTGGGFWSNDGGNLYVNLADYALTNDDNTTSYHVFLVQDYVQKPSATPASDGEYNDPFANDDGTNVTYDNAAYSNANWTDKPLAATSSAFLNGQGAGQVLPYGAGVGYQIMVASFADSDGDGFGDIYGIQQKLDYLYNLGVNVLWLTPIQKSDSYHGYDISDYLQVDAKFGSKISPAAVEAGKVTYATAMEDYKALIQAAHAKGMAVVMDLVINHTSTSNNWFISSAQLDKATRGYYQWGNHETQSENINKDKFWYPYGTHAYSYYAKFGSSMPELNYAYQSTREAVEDVALTWCSIGVDGFRMDAVKHIFLEEEVASASTDTIVKDISESGDYSSNLSKNLNFWRELNATVKAQYPNAFFVGENFDGHAYHVSPYYEGFDSLFDFYSYFNLTSIASSVYNNGNTGAYFANLPKFLGDSSQLGEKDLYSAGKDSDLAGAKNIKYGSYWALANVLDTNNQYRTGGNKGSTSSGYSMIDGSFTSNHDIARNINRVAGTTYNNEGLTAQGNVSADQYGLLDTLSTLVEITQLMLPGCTWIYYGDELGMTGNFAEGQTSTSAYADLVYRQPMKWKQGGIAGDGSYTCGYSISGSGVNINWDNINASETVADAEKQVANENSHYSAIKTFANIKSKTPALIKGYLQAEKLGSSYTAAKITRTLGSKTYYLYVNFGGSEVSGIPAYTAILNEGNTEVARYTGNTSSGGGSIHEDGDVQYTINSLPTWITNNGCQVFAWVWGGNYGEGAWLKCTYLDETSLKVMLDGSATGMLLVRCVSGTTVPNWKTKGDNPGRIYNKTGDITLSNGVTTYTSPSWSDYNPS